MNKLTDIRRRTCLIQAGFLMGAVSALALSPCRLLADDAPSIESVVKLWVDTAASVTTYEVRLQGKDVRPTEDLRSAKIPIEDQSAEVALDFEIEYLFRRPDEERFTRRGLLPSNVGLRQFNRCRVLAGDHARALDEGGENSHFAYDQFKLEPRVPMREPVLQPIRNLLNVAGSGKGPFFDGKTFEIVSGSEQVIDGVECLLAESATKRGARLWFERAKPHRIHKCELEHLVADRSGHVEYRYKYADAASQPPDSADATAFVFPKGWEITVFAPDGKIRSQVQCEVISARANMTVPDSAFDLTPPPGAIISDYRQPTYEHFLQLADGTTQPLKPREMGSEKLFRLSASVAGSRIANQVLAGSPETMRSSRIWLVVLNVAIVIALIGAYRLTRKPGRVA